MRFHGLHRSTHAGVWSESVSPTAPPQPVPLMCWDSQAQCDTVFEGGALGRYLGPEGGALLNGITLTKEAPESSRAPPTSEDAGGAGDPKEGPHLTVLAPRFQVRSFRNCEQSTSVFISRLVCAVLLQGLDKLRQGLQMAAWTCVHPVLGASGCLSC